jgi:hypothetical protein
MVNRLLVMTHLADIVHPKPVLGLLSHGSTPEFVGIVAGGAVDLASIRVQWQPDTLLPLCLAHVGGNVSRGNGEMNPFIAVFAREKISGVRPDAVTPGARFVHVVLHDEVVLHIERHVEPALAI